ncbi:MAG: type II toxin-antitoxin system RelE/ParE family toxin [Candidatus Binatia bacterium]
MKRSLVVEEDRLPLHRETARLIATLTPEIKKLVRSPIDTLLEKPHTGSELTGELEGYRSLKAKRYRIIYRLNDAQTSTEIYHVGHRRDVYDTLRSLLLGIKQ